MNSDQGNNHHDYPLPFDNVSLPNQIEYLGREKQANYTNKLPLERIMHIHRAKSKYSTKKKESCPHKFVKWIHFVRSFKVKIMKSGLYVKTKKLKCISITKK